MRKSLVQTIAIISIFLPWCSLYILGMTWAGLRWSLFTDITMSWWMILVILPLICIGVQFIYLVKKVLWLPMLISLSIWIVWLVSSIIVNFSSINPQTAFDESMKDWNSCAWSCNKESMELFFKERGVNIKRNLNQSDLESIIWTWRNGNDHIEIVKIWPNIYFKHAHKGYSLMPINIAPNWSYLFMWRYSNTWINRSKAKKIKEYVKITESDNWFIDRIYITPEWLELLDLSFRGNTGSNVDWRYKQYVR